MTKKTTLITLCGSRKKQKIKAQLSLGKTHYSLYSSCLQ